MNIFSYKIKKFRLLIAILVAILFMVVFGLFLDNNKNNQQIKVNSPKVASASNGVDPFEEIKQIFGLPARIYIPQINVDSLIVPVGLTTNEELDIPRDPDTAGWFERGARPGENGVSVITGHYGWKDDIKAVFDDLDKLQIGDKIYIEDENKQTITFIVSKIDTFNPKADASEIFSSNDNKSHLNLITCEGIWNQAEKGYPERLVIFADKE